MRSGRTEKHLPSPTVLGWAKSALLMTAFGLDPIGSLDRYFMPAGRALEITRFGRGAHRLLFLYDPEYNRRFMLNMKGMRTAGLWPVTAPDGTAQKSLRSHPLKARGPEQAAFHEMMDPYLSRSAVNQSFSEIQSIVLSEITTW